MRVPIILVCVVGVALAAVAPKCCSDREFEVIMGEVGGSMYNMNGHFVQSFINGYNKLYYDAHNEKMAVDAIITSNGNTTKTNIVFDYANKGMYVTPQGGSCTRYQIKESFRKPCIPDDAVFDGYSYMGYGTQQLEVVTWRYIEPGTDHLHRYTVTREGCVPVVLANLGHYLKNQTLESDTFFLYNSFSPSISQRSVFKTPKNCAHGDTFLPVPVGRSLRGVRALYMTPQ